MLLNFCEIFFNTEDSIDTVYAQGGKGQNTTSKCIFKISHWQKITLTQIQELQYQERRFHDFIINPSHESCFSVV